MQHSAPAYDCTAVYWHTHILEDRKGTGVCLCVHSLPWIVLHGKFPPHGKGAKESPRTSLTLSQGCGKCVCPNQLGASREGVGRRKEEAGRKREAGSKC